VIELKWIVMKKVLIALDFDSSAEKVAETGFKLAASANAQVILMHVTSEANYYSSLNYSPITGFGIFSNEDLVEKDTAIEQEEIAGKFLKKFQERWGNETTDMIVRNGDFADSILSVAGELKVDMIVVGTHGRGGLKKMLLGSVTEEVLHQTSIPLLIIPVRD
jgi:nucleotide-binding universal stress UspA family protein